MGSEMCIRDRKKGENSTVGLGELVNYLYEPSTSSWVCITVSNSPNPSRVYIRLCKHRKRFLLLKYKIIIKLHQNYYRNPKMLEIPPSHTDRENHCYQVIVGLSISLFTLASLLKLQSFSRNERSTLHFPMEW